ncbi:unnamed protein product [Bemisia tabaci]|uniref:Uncharacterized protein n=1 Tax=Bemisia tabaci TaxID=7038 RepID=A0A9P0A377_BEMTA|nr:unnamed protein product [Bemisia tabaci]
MADRPGDLLERSLLRLLPGRPRFDQHLHRRQRRLRCWRTPRRQHGGRLPQRPDQPPPNGSIDYTQSPPRVKGLSDYFLGVNNIFIDSNDVMYVCDSGRAIDRNGYQALASVGGPKIVVISLENDTVIATYIFTEDVAPNDSYLSAITVDTKNNVIYIADASGTGRNAILLLDLSTGLTRRLLQNKYAVTALYGFVPYTWGQPNYQVVTDSQGNPLRATFINYGVTGLALSPGGNTLCFSRLGGRYLYCVSTEILRNPNATDSEIDSYVRNYGEKGWSAGLIFDSLYTLYGGQSEQDGVFQLLFTTQLVTLYIHDPRINFAYSFDIYNGSLCFINNQLNYLKAVYPGEGRFLVDRRVLPYYVSDHSIDSNWFKTSIV